MLLLHQTGSVKIGEVVRYTVTYTPSQDRILPSPECLYLRIKNSSAIALRAAFVHGPYNLSVAAYPATFNPNEKFDDARRYGVPEFEPMLKAGGNWTCHLVVPEHIRQSAGTGGSAHFGNGPEHDGESVSWVIEVASQIIFSSSAVVHYDVLLARDEKSLTLSSSIPVVGNQAQVPQPGRVTDFQQSKGAKDGRHAAQAKGVFSRAIHLKVEDTASLWNTPQLPGMEQSPKQADSAKGTDTEAVQTAQAPKDSKEEDRKPKKRKHVHLVILTHGLHSNLGSDMLYLKESIDAGAKQAKLDAKERRAKERAARKQNLEQDSGLDEEQAGKGAVLDEPDEDTDTDEETIVRGFSGNATRTERGIKYLGKRLARYVLSVTYPDQPFLPAGKAAQEVLSHALKGEGTAHKDASGKPAHKHSSIHKDVHTGGDRGYNITKISFVGHSLGGLIQTYAIAYIQKHSPQFFDLIKPINFIAMASPFLGLNHENPMYVKFALDFGLVGRTGQDLGLTWRAPTIARNGWGAIVSNLGENAQKKVLGESQPESKPLLRILPTGPAHIALKKFRNRTVYSNVVNDGIVPLRTSCLLFLDWQGLGRVEKARREAGLVETVVGFGWAELTGANVTTPRTGPWTPREGSEVESAASGATTPAGQGDSHEVPQPSTDAVLEDDKQSLRTVTASYQDEGQAHSQPTATTNNNTNPFSGFFAFFGKNKDDTSKPPPPPSPKQRKIYQRSQTLRLDDNGSETSQSSQSKVTSGHELSDDAQSGVSAPPRTTFFESAGDVLNPKLPSVEYLIDPSKRPRTIFHDRVYHPADIPPPPLKKRPTGSLAIRRRPSSRTPSSSSIPTSDSGSPAPYFAPQHHDSVSSTKDYDDTSHTNPDKDPNEIIDSSNMKVEEKIARAYHRDLSWRKVLVSLEPDAHNNMICRRLFANAFGWPVVKHLVDAHFSDSATARLRDEDAKNTERAKTTSQPPDEHGAETRSEPVPKDPPAQSTGDKDDKTIQPIKPREHNRTASERLEAQDRVSALPGSTPRGSSEDRRLHSGSPSPRPIYERLDSVSWSERDWADSGTESEVEDTPHGSIAKTHASDEGQPKSHGQADKDKKLVPDRSSSPLSGAFWTEKIVGKGAVKRRSMSPTNQSSGAQNTTEPPKHNLGIPGAPAPKPDDVD
ncbi:Putative lipase ROG1 [Cytospora mali]|uniref:Lipase ROG1 n=1 Tax=Cytospora mali TaxID=578113 RepID=A0A194VWI6_CYTMA|nr:Putative lipase ROG1 [Valsa mali]